MPGFNLTLVRHGETELNRTKIIQGQGGDAVLNEKGQKQAQALGKFLSSESYTHIYASDLSRARETCELILSNNQDPEQKNRIKLDQRIRERNYGIYEGRPMKELAEIVEESGVSCRDDYTPEGGETKLQIKKRANSFFIDLCDLLFDYCKENVDKRPNVLVVSHGALIRIWLLFLSDKYRCGFPNGEKLTDRCPNTGRSSFVVNFSKNYEPCKNDLDSDINCNLKISMKCAELYNTDHFELLET